MKPGAVPMILCLQAIPLESIGESAGSVATMRSPGMRSRSQVDSPEIVPPVPVVQTSTSRSAPKSSKISSAVRRCDSGFAGL